MVTLWKTSAGFLCNDNLVVNFPWRPWNRLVRILHGSQKHREAGQRTHLYCFATIRLDRDVIKPSGWQARHWFIAGNIFHMNTCHWCCENRIFSIQQTICCSENVRFFWSLCLVVAKSEITSICFVSIDIIININICVFLTQTAQ